MKKILIALFLFSSFAAFSQSTTLVISQAYGGGGGTTGTYLNDYVELHNISSVSQSINGMSLQYGSATGQFGSSTTNIFALPNVSIPAGGYYLVQLSSAGTGGVALPVTPDVVTTNLSMSGTSGKVALANQTTALGCGATATPCTLPSGSIIDLVAWGTANNAEGGVSVNNGVALTSTQGCVRKTNGCTETNNNNSDFDVVTAPVPRNSTSSAVVCGAAVPSLSISSPLTAFGNICLNNEAGPNSFTISGSNLTTANVDVAALAGYTYSTTSGGTYTSTLSIPQAGGTFSQQVFVKFTPTAVQSYAGNIVVSGGGAASSVNAAASGTGINTAPSVTTGTPATSITQTTATAPGSITANGCSAVTAYGIEYSTTSGFVNGTGTQVASSNLSSGNFSSDLTGLTANTPYYYKAYATNSGGTTYGAEQTFTTLPVPVPVLNATALTAFGNICTNSTAGPNSFTITGTNLTTADVTVATLSGFTYSTTSGGTYTSSLTLTQPGGSFSQEVFVKFDPTLVQSYDGNIVVAGGGASASVDVAASGAGVNTMASVSTGSASSITTTSATAAGSISANGCSAVTAYGIEYSATAGFVNGTGTQVASSNLSSGNFSSDLTGLTPNTPYYYKAYATNAGGTAYGAEQTFTTLSLTPSINATALTSFGDVCLNTTAGPNSFTINGSALTTADITVGPLAGYTFATTSGGTYTASLTLTQPGGTFTQDVFVKFTPAAVQSYNGNIAIAGGGAASIDVAAAGAGINTAPSVTTGAASAITSVSATAAGSITATGCSAITAYGIEYSTTNGFANGSGTQVASSNLSGGSFTSSLTGLAPVTTYYYKAYATNAGGTVWGAQQSFVTATPGITTDALTPFGSICLNTTNGPVSFTITGTNLTPANVTVGPLAGYTFSATSGGTYTASLTLTQPGGSYSQQVFVKFTPTAVQSYNGNIAVNGGGITAAVNVAVSGSGVNTTATATTGAASAITYNSATAAGSITATGCSAVTVYGIEYSTTNGFANGTGTQITSSNLSGGNFTSALTGLAASTVYYYKAYATNAGGTAYGSQQTFTTAPVPIALTATSLNPFGNYCINVSSASQSFTISGAFLTTANINVGPLAGYTFSTTSGGTYSASLSLTQPGGTYSQVIYVRFTPTAVQDYIGNIPVAGGGFGTTVNVAASGSGVNTMATVVTGTSSNLNNHSGTLAGSIAATGCSNVTAYGIEYSGINGFANGTGIKAVASNLSGGGFSVNLDGLVQGATYYYKAYATNAGGTSYGLQQSFTVPAINQGFYLYPAPAQRGSVVRLTKDKVKPGYYGLLLFNSNGQLVFQKDMNIQADFINQAFTIPATLTPGVYTVLLVHDEDLVATRMISIF